MCDDFEELLQCALCAACCYACCMCCKGGGSNGNPSVHPNNPVIIQQPPTPMGGYYPYPAQQGQPQFYPQQPYMHPGQGTKDPFMAYPPPQGPMGPPPPYPYHQQQQQPYYPPPPPSYDAGIPQKF